MLDYNKNIEPRRSNAPVNKSFTFDSRRAISQSTITYGQHRSRHPESSSSRRPPSSRSSSLNNRRTRSFSAPPRRVAQYMYLSQQQSRAQNSTPSSASQSSQANQSKVTFSETQQVSKSESKASTSGKNFLTSLVKNTIMSITKSSPSLTRRNSFSGSLNSDRGKQGEKQSANVENKTVKSILQVSKNNKNSPGVVGITNHGNTCFINAIVQCLSNTQPLAEYLISNYDRFEKPLLLSFAALLKSLWTDRYEAKLSHRFRTRVAAVFEQFRDGSQNDAQEFLLLLLDQLQQELPGDNGQTKNSYRGTDEPTNNIVKSLFEAKLTSCLTCSRCRNCSFATDTILTLCLPIQEMVVVRTIYIPHSEGKYRLYAFQVNSGDTIRQFKQLICQKVGALPKHVVMVNMNKQGHYRQLITDHMTLASIMPIEYFFTIQLKNKRSSTEVDPLFSLPHLHKQRKLDDHFSPRSNHLAQFRQNGVNGNNNNNDSYDGNLGSDDENQHDEQFINIVAYPLVYNGNDFQNFGSLAAVSVSRLLSYRELQNILFNKMKIFFVSLFHTMKNFHSMFRIRVHASDHHSIENYEFTDEGAYLSPKHEMPLLSLVVDRVLSHFAMNGLGIPYLRVFVEFRQEALKYIQNIKEQAIMVRDPSYDEHYSKKTGSTLASCLETFTQKEQLGSDNFWKCSECQSRQAGTTKSLSFSSLPEVLIIHLKRFKQIGDERTKLETYVDFPLNNLELSRFARFPPDQSALTDASNSTTDRMNRSWVDVLQSLPNKIGDKGSKFRASPNEDYTYDLFAICNHHGDLQSGHYTAFCQNSITKKWYKYDDEKVGEVPSTDVVTNSAYMLFYWRRGHRSHSPFSLNNFINEQRAANGNSSSSKSTNGYRGCDSSHSLSADSLAVSTPCSASAEALNQLPVNVHSTQLKNHPAISTQSSENINSQPLKSILKSSQPIAISTPALTQKHKSPPAAHVTINEFVATVYDDGVSGECVMKNKQDQRSTTTQPEKSKHPVVKPPSEDQFSKLATTLKSKSAPSYAIQVDVQSTKSLYQPRDKKPLIHREVQKMFIENHVKNSSSSAATPKKSANLIFEKVPISGRTYFSSASSQSSIHPEASRSRDPPRTRFDRFKQESTV